MNSETGIQKANGGSIEARQGFGEQAITQHTMGVSVLQAKEEAEVKARYIMAAQNLRDYDDARIRLQRACMRKSFAEVAIYRKPIGGGKTAEGLSIRFAEEAARAWGNLYISKSLIADEPDKEIWKVYCVDLESNVTESEDVTVEKTVEQSFMRDGEPPIAVRTNSRGKPTYLYPADEGRLVTKRRAALSKSKRAVVLAQIPGDIQDDCKGWIYQTRDRDEDRDPTAARKRLVDAFAAINVMPSQLAEYLEHPVEQVTPAEIDDLRGIFAGLKSGDIESWAEVMAGKKGEDGEPAKADASTTAAKQKVRERMKKPPSNPGEPPPREPGED